ncbi:MAG: AraC family transcriptional regulator [Phreatobacter sp.]|uniref:AraC family transcriptional regulator n=1 Tax=Phreatobacter sp. TaxID=1966341 RepID=UPI002734DA15|nr:AraC family transcriptional regulator [Phreatobacter sp.]MDP2801582.1 AraC family transcriptional regulator [Phreatobacter sp.]
MLLKPLDPASGGRLEHCFAASWSGLVAKTSRRLTDYSISYASHPSETYLALHHFTRRDGETRIDGVPRSALCDLRGKLTQIPAGCGAEAWTIGPSNAGHVTMMFFDPGKLAPDLGRLHATSPVRPRLFFEDIDLIAAMTRLDRVLTDGEGLDDLQAESIGLFIAARVLELSRLDASPEKNAFGTRSRMAVLDDYLRANIGTPVSIEDLAQLVGLSRFHLIRSFRDAFGATPYQYFLRLRMNEAKRLLTSTTMPVAQVAKQVGFSNSTQFVKMFRAMEGVTPGSVRQR